LQSHFIIFLGCTLLQYLTNFLSEISGELKLMLSMVTGLEPREQRLLFRGKEREDSDHLHMVGVRDKDKVLLLEDPALKDMKLQALAAKSCRARASLLSKCSPVRPVVVLTITTTY